MEYSRVRVYELAKEFGLDNKDILEICENHDIPVKSHSSSIAQEDAQVIRTEIERHFDSEKNL